MDFLNMTGQPSTAGGTDDFLGGEDAVPTDFDQALKGALADPYAVSEYTKNNAAVKQQEGLSFSEAMDAAWTGAKTGIGSHAPENIARAVRTIGMWTGNQTIQDYATEWIDAQVRERQEDPWYQPDESWINKEWGKYIYEGVSSVASSTATAVGGAAATAGAVMGAKALAGGAAGMALFSKAAALAGYIGVPNMVYGASAFDSFVEDATVEAQKYEPGVTRETIMSEQFWNAAMSGVAEGGTGALQDLLMGKFSGLIGKAAGPVSGIVTRTIKNVVANVASEVGEEAATAAIQDYARELGGLDYQGRLNAIKSVIGPTVVAGALGGGIQTGLSSALGNRGQGQQDGQQGESPDGLQQIQLGLERAREERRLDTAFSPETLNMRQQLIDDQTFEPLSVANVAPATPEVRVQRAEALVGAVEGMAQQVSQKMGVDMPSALGILEPDIKESPSLNLAVANLLSPEVSQQETLASVADYAVGGLDEDNTTRIMEHYTDFNQLADDMASYKRDKAYPENMPDTVKPAFNQVVEIADAMYDGVSRNTGLKLNDSVRGVLGTGGILRRERMVPSVARDKAALETIVRNMEASGKPVTLDSINIRDVAGAIKVDPLTGGTPKNGIEAFKQWMKAIEPALAVDTQTRRADVDTMGAAEATVGSIGEIRDDSSAEFFRRSLDNIYGADKSMAVMNKVIELVGEKVIQVGREVRQDNSLENQFRLMTLVEQLKAMQQVRRGVDSEWGRLGRYIGIKRKDNKYAEKISAALAASGGKKWAELPKLLENAESDAQRQSILDAATKTNTWDMFAEYVTAGMLMGPSTHVVNAISNSAQLVKMTMERGYAALTNNQGPSGIQAQEFTDYILGMWDGMKTLKRLWTDHKAASGGTVAALRNARGLLQSTDNLGIMEEARELGGAITGANVLARLESTIPGSGQYLTQHHAKVTDGLSSAVDIMGSIIRTPFTFLEAGDKVFKVISGTAELRAQARRAAGKDNELFQRLLANPTEEMRETVMETMREATFQQDMGPIGQALNRVRLQYPVTRLAIPFLKTPMNVLTEGMAMTPGLNRLLGDFQRRLKSPDTATRQLAEAKLMVGSLIWSTGLTLAAAGLLTPPPPADRDLRDKMLAQGMRFNAIKVGDEYFEISRLDPLAFVLNAASLVANGGEFLSEKDLMSSMLAGLGASTRLVTDRSYVRSLSDLLDLIQDPSKAATVAQRRLGGMLVPASGLGRTLNRTDPFMREVGGFFDAMKANIPGMSESLPARRDFLGRPIQSTQYAGNQFFSPFAKGTQGDDPVVDEVARLVSAGFSPSPALRNNFIVGGNKVTLEGEDYTRFMDFFANEARDKKTGLTYYEWIGFMMNTPEYKAGSDEWRSKKISSGRRKFIDQAKDYILGNSSTVQGQLLQKNGGLGAVFGRTRMKLRAEAEALTNQ